jgi:hypothetical protein
MIFSHRYLRALEQGKVSVELSPDVRNKLWAWMTRHDASVYVRRDPSDNWISNSSVLAEVENDLQTEHGWEHIPAFAPSEQPSHGAALKHLVTTGTGQFVLDSIEMQYAMLGKDEKEAFRAKINEVLGLHGCPWRLSDGEFFKLDNDFIGARLAVTAHESLAANELAGAADEYAKARRELGAGDVKDAILHAGKSYESVLKVLSGLEHANANRLVNEILKKGLLDDLPEPARQAFAKCVFLTSLSCGWNGPMLQEREGSDGTGGA